MTTSMTVKEASQLILQNLQAFYPKPEIESFTFLIFNHLMKFQRFDLHLKAEMPVPDHLDPQIYDIIEQLKHNKPIQYILGSTEFYGLPFYVDESVLIPRPETEELVHWIIEDYGNSGPMILDLGTGSGCIPVALAKNISSSMVMGADISVEALETARKNALRNNVDVTFIELDILADHLPELGKFDVIVSNPPYVTIQQKERMEANVVDFEPHVALFVPQKDPLIFYKAISRFARKFLKANGSLYFEINEDLSDETGNAVKDCGFSVELRKDINGKYRMLKAQ
jgi:release factor glutamine methyltransferase